MSNIDKLKPGKYAVLFRNNWDGEGDTYETFAILDAEGIWRDEDGDELLEYQGDEVLKAWPLDDGSDVLALLDELEAKNQRLNEIITPNMLLPVIDDMDEENLRHVIKTVCENYSLLHAKWEASENRAEAAEKRVAELSALLRKPIAWESTTPVYIKFITDERYQRLRPGYKKWYKPYRCSQCSAAAKGESS